MKTFELLLPDAVFAFDELLLLFAEGETKLPRKPGALDGSTEIVSI
jgi:hypothetical protein